MLTFALLLSSFLLYTLIPSLEWGIFGSVGITCVAYSIQLLLFALHYVVYFEPMPAYCMVSQWIILVLWLGCRVL